MQEEQNRQKDAAIEKLKKDNSTLSTALDKLRADGTSSDGIEVRQAEPGHKPNPASKLAAIEGLPEENNEAFDGKEPVDLALSLEDQNAAKASKASEEITQLKIQLEAAFHCLPGIDNAASKEMIKGLVETVTKERAEVRQQRSDLVLALRRKEHEFRSKETSLKETLRVQEEQLKQKEGVNEKLKINNSILSTTLDQLRADAADSNDRVELTHKLVTAEKLYQKANEDAERAQKRAEEVQKRLSDEVSQRASLQVETARQRRQIEDFQKKISDLSSEARKGVSAELASMTEQRDKAQRMIDELKRQTRELQGKLAAAAQGSKSGAVGGVQSPAGKSGSNGPVGGGNEAEFRHKLDLANHMVKMHKDELEKSKKRVEELKAQEGKYRAEISKLQGEVAKAQTELKAAGIKSTRAQGAAGAAGKSGTGVAAKSTIGSGKPGVKK